MKDDKQFTIPDYPKQPISFALWQKIVTKYGEFETERILYRAWKARPKKLVPWLMCGLRRGYLSNTCTDEWNNQEYVRAWINTHLRREQPAKAKMNEEPAGIKGLVKGVLRETL